MQKLPKIIQKALDECGASWRLETRARHTAILIEERLVAIIPRGHLSDSTQRGNLNVRAAIRRATAAFRE